MEKTLIPPGASRTVHCSIREMFSTVLDKMDSCATKDTLLSVLALSFTIILHYYPFSTLFPSLHVTLTFSEERFSAVLPSSHVSVLSTLSKDNTSTSPPPLSHLTPPVSYGPQQLCCDGNG